MCGIAGLVVNSLSDVGYWRSAVAKMTQSLLHRGPDGNGYWDNGNVYFGHRRLSIIDIDHGHQPLRGDQGCVVIFNGEIYNYKEIKIDLEQKGIVFSTHSDTEVLIKAYEYYGTDCLSLFIGMFAFAIFDPNENKIFLARDRLGKKPLYYHIGKTAISFGSEIKALLQLDWVAEFAEINPLALFDYLSLGYILSPKSIYKGIKQLPPAHFAELNLVDGSLSLHPYWCLENYVVQTPERYTVQRQEEFYHLLINAVKIRLRSDVEIGGYLSGGMDSASVLALANKLSENDIRAFCLGFQQASYDESEFAQQSADHLEINLTIFSGLADLRNSFKELVAYMDAPISDTSLLPCMMLNKMARKNVKVALTGDGADEWLAGYETYQADEYYRIYAMLPKLVQQSLVFLAQGLFRPNNMKVSQNYKVKKFLQSAGMSRERAHYHWRTIFSDLELKEIMSGSLIEACGDYNPFTNFRELFGKVSYAQFLDQCMYVDMKTWLADDILVKIDRTSMAHGLELRSPFLDHRLIEMVLPTERRAKRDGRRRKAILQDVMRQILPPEIFERSKMGFNSPTDSVGDMKIANGPFDSLFNQHFNLNPRFDDLTFKSFSIAVLNSWLEKFGNYKISGDWTN